MNRSVKPLKSPKALKSPKVTRILLLAVFAAGLSACSGGGETSAASATPTASVSEPTSAPASGPTDGPTDGPATESATPQAPVSPAATASPSVPGLRGLDAVVLGEVKRLKAGSITVKPEKGEKREAMLTPFTLVLDVQGGVCKEGELPHRCNAAQLEKALKAGNTFYGKVTIKDGVAERIEEIVGE
ncbi:hypothetical protein ACQPYK_05640 [Streptosporangium sp. CA-135522]|uniref:hypothetical protein n=1 Tax=Streptosporangium sp. CA-135522 TaxID=3240072 RepID=UPI003D928FB8